jgi:hypothetical protein
MALAGGSVSTPCLKAGFIPLVPPRARGGETTEGEAGGEDVFKSLLVNLAAWY